VRLVTFANQEANADERLMFLLFYTQNVLIEVFRASACCPKNMG